MPFFSIVIPVYNVAPYLRECLDSVLSQSFADWEAICVDDGSTDGSGNILDEYALSDIRIQVVHKEVNGGVGEARNAALNICAGAWVFFLDADDLIHQHGLAYLRQIIDTVPNAEIIRVSGFDFAECDTPNFTDSVLQGTYSVLDISKQLDFIHVGMCPIAFRRDIAQRIRVKPYAYGEDLLFGAEALVACQKLVLADGQVYGYRQRATSAMHSPMTYARILDEMRSRLEKLLIFGTSGKAVKRSFFRSECRALSTGAVQMIDKAAAIDRPAIWQELFRINMILGHISWLPPDVRYIARIIGATKCAFLTRFLTRLISIATCLLIRCRAITRGSIGLHSKSLTASAKQEMASDG